MLESTTVKPTPVVTVTLPESTVREVLGQLLGTEVTIDGVDLLGHLDNVCNAYGECSLAEALQRVLAGTFFYPGCQHAGFDPSDM